MNLFIFLFLPLFADDKTHILISQDILDRLDLPAVNYGFSLGQSLYLSNLAHIVKTDLSGKILASFNRKGPGPEELVAGGPIFMLKDKLWCMDVLAGRFLVLDRDLKPIGQKKFIEASGVDLLNIAPGMDYLYALSHYDPLKSPLMILKIDPNTMSVIHRTALSNWHSQGIAWSSLKISSMGNNSLAIWENTQNQEYYRILIWNLDTDTALTLKHITPSRAPNLPRKGKFFAYLLIEGASYLRTVRHEDNGYRVGFDIPKEPNHAVINLALDVEPMIHVFDKQGKPISAKKSEFRLIDSPGPTDRILLYNPDTGLIIQ